jgi:hypothetical protein
VGFRRSELKAMGRIFDADDTLWKLTLEADAAKKALEQKIEWLDLIIKTRPNDALVAQQAHKIVENQRAIVDNLEILQLCAYELVLELR